MVVMNSEIIANPSIAVCKLKRAGKTERINVAAAQRGKNLTLSTFKDNLSTVEGVINGTTELHSIPHCLLDELTHARVVIGRLDAFERPIYRTVECIAHGPFSYGPCESGDMASAECEITSANELPAELQSRKSGLPWRDFFGQSGGEVVWIKDAPTGVWWPYHCRGSTSQAPATIQVAARQYDRRHQCRAGHPREIEQSASWKTGTGLLKRIIPEAQLYSMVAYYDSVLRSGAMRLGDRDSECRSWMHNEGWAQLLCAQLVGMVSLIAGCKVEPYFAHFVSYLPGSSLPVHLDREARAISLSVQLGYFKFGLPAPNSWAFYVKPWQCDMFVSYNPDPGDTVFFWGASQEHFRETIPANCRSDVLLLHYLITNS
jgi:hypothetical protein